MIGADPLTEQQTGVAVACRQQVDHPDGVDGLEHARIGGFARSRGHQVDGFGEVCLPGRIVPVVDLAVADQHRRSGVDGHERNLPR